MSYSTIVFAGCVVAEVLSTKVFEPLLSIAIPLAEATLTL